MAQLNPEDDSILIFSVALWLQNKGFSKVLKRFCTAAQIEGEDWKAKAFNLNEIFTKYQEIFLCACYVKQEEPVADVAEKTANGSTAEEINGKKKNKKSKNDTSVNDSEKTLEDTAMAEKLNESLENGYGDESGRASKKSNVKQEAISSENAEATEDGIDESKKVSKKRKRMLPDETENKSGGEVAIEESKSKKSKCLKESKDVPEANGHAFEGNFMNVSANSNEIGKSSQKKSANKQPKSSEPTTAKAFQRVKIDEVEFVDDRLQDNSYWAKDGAETGYGAKAQEVLGQVKGSSGNLAFDLILIYIRGFRHEKTKRKRGSYRGGQMDLQSHSVKFNYFDEE
ncbi:hypothetical protein SASPL_138521 [Salvia splendens]|uniref:Srp40 C-terminal domain-containing protein n=1 Tax=Salvia splendens TaxID=180675 RepID=A0A8X8ZED4_SALSN|nr:hypothetical protein SASPL_138521 [Salvia splendens]